MFDAIIEDGEMIVRYTCDGKAIGQTMFLYTSETYVGFAVLVSMMLAPHGNKYVVY